tara:strand:+ start:2953 stop:3156 length:204 start_codon:yes stop_codon:yes gene_type:complete
MKALSLLLLFIGSLLLVSGITQENMLKKSKVLYKYFPSITFDRQFQNINLQESLPALFDEEYNQFYR